MPGLDNRLPIQLEISFWVDEGEPMFGVSVYPYGGAGRLEDDAQLRKASTMLLKNDFRQIRDTWWREHRPDEYLDAPDVSERLLTRIVHETAAAPVVGAALLSA